MGGELHRTNGASRVKCAKSPLISAKRGHKGRCSAGCSALARQLDRGDEAIAAPRDIDNEPAPIASVTQRTAQCRNMDGEVGRLDKQVRPNPSLISCLVTNSPGRSSKTMSICMARLQVSERDSLTCSSRRRRESAARRRSPWRGTGACAAFILFSRLPRAEDSPPRWIESMRLTNGRPGFLQKEREDRSDNNRGDIDAAGGVEDIQR
jgi:hypothetical protein